MELLAQRPACTMSGEEALAALDALHAELASLQTYRLTVLDRLHQTGHTKEVSGLDTARFIATRHRLNQPQVQRDLNLATALHKYPTVTAALPAPHIPTGDNAPLQYADAHPHVASDSEAAGAHPDALDPDAADAQPGPHPDDPDADPHPVDLDRHAPGPDSDVDEAGNELAALGVLPVLLHPEQAEAIVSCLEAVPSAANVPVENLLVAEAEMVEAARHLGPWELKKLGKRVRDILDTDGAEPAEQAAERRESLRLGNAPQGVKFSGFLANENAELFRTMIEAAAKPHKTADGQLDPRSREKRQADALTEVLAAAAETGDLSGHGGVKPHITVTIDYTDLKAMGRDATGDLQFGENLSAAAVRRLACDAGIIPIVLGSASEPLDVGREQRYVTKAMRRALNNRDKGCVVCRMPARYCDAHHIVHWIDGGETSLNNLALVCGGDHIAVHAGHYTIAIINGKAHVTRPTWADPPRHPKPSAPHTPTTSGGCGGGLGGCEDDSCTCEDGRGECGDTLVLETGTSQLTGTDGRPWPEADGPLWPEADPTRSLRTARALPLANDRPPVGSTQTPDFDPWGPEVLDTG